MNWYEKQMKKLGYKGCRNCKHQIDVLRTCKWLESGGDGIVHLICPKWNKREANEYHNCGAKMVNENEEMSKVSETEMTYAEYLND